MNGLTHLCFSGLNEHRREEGEEKSRPVRGRRAPAEPPGPGPALDLNIFLSSFFSPGDVKIAFLLAVCTVRAAARLDQIALCPLEQRCRDQQGVLSPPARSEKSRK